MANRKTNHQKFKAQMKKKDGSAPSHVHKQKYPSHSESGSSESVGTLDDKRLHDLEVFVSNVPHHYLPRNRHPAYDAPHAQAAERAQAAAERERFVAERVAHFEGVIFNPAASALDRQSGFQQLANCAFEVYSNTNEIPAAKGAELLGRWLSSDNFHRNRSFYADNVVSLLKLLIQKLSEADRPKNRELFNTLVGRNSEAMLHGILLKYNEAVRAVSDASVQKELEYYYYSVQNIAQKCKYAASQARESAGAQSGPARQTMPDLSAKFTPAKNGPQKQNQKSTNGSAQVRAIRR